MVKFARAGELHTSWLRCLPDCLILLQHYGINGTNPLVRKCRN